MNVRKKVKKVANERRLSLDRGQLNGDPVFYRVVYVYRPGESVERLEAPEEVSGEPVFPGFVLRTGSIWFS